MKIEDILIKKAHEGSLAHFYIVETGLPEEESAHALMEFSHNFIRDYFQKVEKQTHPVNHLMDHPDVLVVTGVEEKKDYTVEDATLLEKYFSWRPVQSQRKFVVIPEAHRITQILANKWLKMLEEPPVPATIFLLNPRRIKLLPTIQSRGLGLRLPRKKSPHDAVLWQEFITAVKPMGLAQFLETYSKSEKGLHFWLEELLEWETGENLKMENKMALEGVLRLLEEMDTFNQPAATKWTFFYSHLKEHVLPRLNIRG